MSDRFDLFAPLDPYESGILKVSDLHDIYFEVSGNPRGKPAVVCHGGPGGGSTPSMRRYFDPALYRIVVFDQRGCGKSTPRAELRENTTWHLVDDMEKLRRHLGVERWQVFGGSWGSTLALAYAQTHPSRVTELVLRGIFTLRKSEIDWFYQGGAHWIWPDAWENYLKPVPPSERGDMVSAYYRILTGADEARKLAAAKAWSAWEGGTVSLIPSAERIASFTGDDFAIAFARIECHYFINRGFFERDDQLISNVGLIRHIPSTIVQGRYDVCTPMLTAFDLHKAWPEAEFNVIGDAGHAASEPGIVDALIRATNKFAGRRA